MDFLHSSALILNLGQLYKFGREKCLLPFNTNFALRSKCCVREEGYTVYVGVQFPNNLYTSLFLYRYVFNGKAYRWALYDLTTWPTHPNVNQMLFLPSTKPTHIQDRIWDMFETVANRY